MNETLVALNKLYQMYEAEASLPKRDEREYDPEDRDPTPSLNRARLVRLRLTMLELMKEIEK